MSHPDNTQSSTREQRDSTPLLSLILMMWIVVCAFTWILITVGSVLERKAEITLDLATLDRVGIFWLALMIAGLVYGAISVLRRKLRAGQE